MIDFNPNAKHYGLLFSHCADMMLISSCVIDRRVLINSKQSFLHMHYVYSMGWIN